MTAHNTTQQLRIGLLGQPHFALGDVAFKFSARPKCVPLLAYLLLHRVRPVPRDTLAFLLWADDTEEDARAKLRRHLNHAQNALPEAPVAWILADSETVQWNPETNFQLDVDEFERLLATEARAQAVTLYAGDLLESLGDEWLLSSRERLRSLYLRALAELVLEHRSARRFAAAIEYAQRILTVDPLREDAVRQLITVRYESGDRAGALQEFERFARQLRAELDVAPMPETTALRDVIVHNSQVSAAPSEKHFGPLVSAPTGLPFAGRAIEMEQLRALWSRAASGRGCVAFVAGEAGIGKTRLASEFAARAEAEGGRVLWGTTAYPETAPYQAFAEALRAALGIVAALDVKPIWLSTIRQLVPELGERRAGLPVLGAVDPEREQTRLLEALTACVAGLARPRPLVLVLEDLHWAGAATISAFEFVARRVEQHAILLVATYRDDETPSSLRSVRRSLQQDASAQHLALGRLRFEAVSHIVASTLAGTDDDGGTAKKLWQASEGSPLFLSELIRDAAESAMGSSLPVTLQNVIESRVARLTSGARSILEIVCVIGPAFDIDVTREITGWDEHALLEALDELLARHLIREAGRRPGFDYVFTHHLIRVAVYEALPAEPRRVRHRRIARAFEVLHEGARDSLASDIARHFELGGDGFRAAPYYLKAARHAESLHAHEEASAFLSRAEAHGLSRDLRCEALLLGETIHRRTGHRSAQQEDIDRLERLGDPDGELRAEVFYRKVLLARSLGSRDEELAFINELERVPEARDARWRGRIFACRADYYALVNRFDEAGEAARAALEIHEALSDVDGQVADLCLLVSVATHLGSLSLAREHLAAAQKLAEATGNPRLVADTLFAASSSALMLHDLTACIALATTATELYVSLGDREGEADALARKATALARLGRRDEAREQNLAAAAIFESIGKRQGLAVAVLNIGLISCRIGVIGRAIGEFERSAVASSARAWRRVPRARWRSRRPAKAALPPPGRAMRWRGRRSTRPCRPRANRSAG
jgi:DNA-binding SARP family transcriptional activator